MNIVFSSTDINYSFATREKEIIRIVCECIRRKMNMNVIVGEDEYFGYEMVLIINRNDFFNEQDVI